MPATDGLLLGRMVGRELSVYRRIWRGSIFSSILSPTLFLGAMGLGLGSLVDDGSGTIDGLDYLQFVTPGLLAATATVTAAVESMWPVMTGTKWLRTYHSVVATPLGPADVLGGLLVWIALRVTLIASVFLVVATVLGGIASPWAVMAVPAAVLGAIAIAAPLTAFSATRDTDVSFVTILRLVIMPMFLFSGTFFPVDQLPPALERVAVLSPLWHAVELARAATTGTGEPAQLLGSVFFLVAIIVAGYLAGRRTFSRRLTP